MPAGTGARYRAVQPRTLERAWLEAAPHHELTKTRKKNASERRAAPGQGNVQASRLTDQAFSSAEGADSQRRTAKADARILPRSDWADALGVCCKAVLGSGKRSHGKRRPPTQHAHDAEGACP